MFMVPSSISTAAWTRRGSFSVGCRRRDTTWPICWPGTSNGSIDSSRARGVKMVIWHDMLTAPSLAKELGAPAGPANGGPPQNTAPALRKIPKDVVLNYWFYDPLAEYPGLDYLRPAGFSGLGQPLANALFVRALCSGPQRADDGHALDRTAGMFWLCHV